MPQAIPKKLTLSPARQDALEALISMRIPRQHAANLVSQVQGTTNAEVLRKALQLHEGMSQRVAPPQGARTQGAPMPRGAIPVAPVTAPPIPPAPQPQQQIPGFGPPGGPAAAPNARQLGAQSIPSGPLPPPIAQRPPNWLEKWAATLHPDDSRRMRLEAGPQASPSAPPTPNIMPAPIASRAPMSPTAGPMPMPAPIAQRPSGPSMTSSAPQTASSPVAQAGWPLGLMPAPLKPRVRVKAAGRYEAPAEAAKPQDLPVISAQEEYDKLPLGARFRHPDGYIYRKESHSSEEPQKMADGGVVQPGPSELQDQPDLYAPPPLQQPAPAQPTPPTEESSQSPEERDLSKTPSLFAGAAPLSYQQPGSASFIASPAPPAGGFANLAAAAEGNVGKLNTSGFAGTEAGRLACAAAVSQIVKDEMGYDLPKTNSTAELYDELKKGWREVPAGTPGAVIVSPTSGGQHGHTGIVGNNGAIYSNSSATGNWEQNYTVDSWNKRFGGLGVHAFLPPQPGSEQPPQKMQTGGEVKPGALPSELPEAPEQKDLYQTPDQGQTQPPQSTDTVPAMLTPGEYVVPKPAVDQIGADNLATLTQRALSGQQPGNASFIPAPAPTKGTGGAGKVAPFKDGVRTMSFGAGTDKPTTATTYGALEVNGKPVKLGTSDIAMSPNLMKAHGLNLGDYVDVLDKDGKVLYPNQRIADLSYISKGKPTTNSIELWGRPEPEGGYTRIRPSAA
jgi:hypothetical protein